jgi:molecular chaperone DnaK
MRFINFAIDLGTTNSLVAQFVGGEVQVFKNPVGDKHTLPSVVAFRNDRIIVGDKAREFISKDPANVFSGFKRKMGTSDSFMVPSASLVVTPVQLSSLVLKELKNFVFNGELSGSVVITIPASFDTIQSNATKKAGYEAGFTEVVLLQEPIAASLAYFNESKKDIPSEGNWLVYDLGGGTFDVALVTIVNGELRVADHEGDNFLGGIDFDTLIIEKLIIPKIIEKTGDSSIAEQLLNKDAALEKLFYVLLYKAEEAKKELTIREFAEIEFTLPGSDEEMYVRISRTDFNAAIHEKISNTVSLIETILKRNNLSAADISNIIMVGGSTYIPYVRELLAERTNIPLALDADPTTAIVVGAAYYAGSKPSAETAPAQVNERSAAATGLRLKSVFQSVSSEDEELFMAIPQAGDFSNAYYRITRIDGGYDSGLKKMDKRISEFLPLQKLVKNTFELRFFDDKNNPLTAEHPPIEITHGKFNVAGQPLPNDICIEVDDIEHNSTRLQVVFERSNILPLKKTIYKEITRTIPKGSKDELVINVLEGTRHSRPHSNLVIGVIEIKGTELTSDLIKGSDIEIKLEMNESRDLTITAFLAMSQQEFKNVFSTSEKHISVSRLNDDVNALIREMQVELREEKGRDEENDWVIELRQCIADAEKLQQRLSKISDKDLTDTKWQVNEERRRISARYDALGSEQRIITLQGDYFLLKEFAEENLPHVDLDQDKLLSEFQRITQDEAVFLKAKSPSILRSKIDALDNLQGRILSNTKHYITSIFLRLSSFPADMFTKPAIATALIKEGEKALETGHFQQLRTAAINLSHLTPRQDWEVAKIKGTGIG